MSKQVSVAFANEKLRKQFESLKDSKICEQELYNFIDRIESIDHQRYPRQNEDSQREPLN